MSQFECLMPFHTKSKTEEPVKEIKFEEAVDILKEVTITIKDVVEQMGDKKRLMLSELLESDSIRFNLLMYFLVELSLDLIEWSNNKLGSEDQMTHQLKKNLLRALSYVKYFLKKFRYLSSSKFYCVQYGKILVGLALIGGSIASFFLIPGADLTAMGVDALLALTGSSVGVSLMGNGLRLIRSAWVLNDDVKLLDSEIGLIVDILELVKYNIVIAQESVRLVNHTTAMSAGQGIHRACADCPDLIGIKNWYDYLTGHVVTLEDIDTQYTY